MRHHSNLLLSSAPRGLLRVFAQANPADVVGELAGAFEVFRTNYDNKFTDLEAAVDQHAQALAASRLGGGGRGRSRPDDPDYSAAFASFFRNGADESTIREANASGHRAQIQAAMSVGDNASGGYLAPTEWDRRISQAQTAKSPLRRLATVQTTGVNAYSTLWNDAAWGSGWVGEAAARPQTTSATLSPIIFATGEIYAMPAATQRLLDDADTDLEKWLSDQVETEFNRQEGIAFLSGNGANKPFGLLQYVTGGAAETQHPGGVLSVAASGSAGSITVDGLVDMVYGLAAPYRQNSTWLMNSMTAGALTKMKDGNGNLIWRESLAADQPPTLLGRPVEFDENMPNVAANAFPIAFGDFKAGYLINDRIGTRVLRDPYTAKPFVLFYVTRRVGGGVLDPRAIRLQKVAVS